MLTPRIAISQVPYTRDVDEALNRAFDHLSQAARRGADIVVFPEWFLGLNPVETIPSRLTRRLAQAARELNLVLITGSIRSLEPETGKKQQRGLVIERDGTIAGMQAKINFAATERPWFEPGTAITAIASRWGRIVILLGLDATDAGVWGDVQSLRPDIVVMAASARTAADQAHLQDLAKTRSAALRCLMILCPLQGRFSGSHYVGNAMVTFRGRILAGTESDGLLTTADPDAPLIQLGVTDAAAHVAVTKPPSGLAAPEIYHSQPEAERRVILDWNLLTQADLLRGGRDLLQTVRDNPRWVALAPAHPQKLRELESLLQEGAVGAFAYPGLAHEYPWSDGVMAWGPVLEKHRGPLLVHCGPGPAPLRFDRPSLWDDFCARYPQVPVILLHMGGPSPYFEEALLLARRHPQVWLETSAATPDALAQALASVGSSRIVFGSGGAPTAFQPEWDKVQQVAKNLGGDFWPTVASLNARELFFHDVEVPRAVSVRETLTIVRPG